MVLKLFTGNWGILDARNEKLRQESFPGVFNRDLRAISKLYARKLYHVFNLCFRFVGYSLM